MKTNKDLIPAFGLAIIVICLLGLTTTGLKADEPLVEQTAKQKLLEEQVEALAGKNMSMEEVLGKGTVILIKRKFVIEKFTCKVALADRKELRRILASSVNYSLKRTNQYISELSTIKDEITEHKCEGK